MNAEKFRQRLGLKKRNAPSATPGNRTQRRALVKAVAPRAEKMKVRHAIENDRYFRSLHGKRKAKLLNEIEEARRGAE